MRYTFHILLQNSYMTAIVKRTIYPTRYFESFGRLIVNTVKIGFDFVGGRDMYLNVKSTFSLNIFKSLKLMVSLLIIVIAVTLKESPNLENAEEENIARRRLVQDRQIQRQVLQTQVPHHHPHLRNHRLRLRHPPVQRTHRMRIARKKIQKKQYLQQF